VEENARQRGRDIYKGETSRESHISTLATYTWRNDKKKEVLEGGGETVFTNIPVKNYPNGATAITNAYSHRTAMKPAMRSSSASTNLESSGSIFQAADPNIILSPSSSSIGKLGAPPAPFEAIVTRSGRVTFAGTLIPSDDTRPVAHSPISGG